MDFKIYDDELGVTDQVADIKTLPIGSKIIDPDTGDVYVKNEKGVLDRIDVDDIVEDAVEDLKEELTANKDLEALPDILKDKYNAILYMSLDNEIKDVYGNELSVNTPYSFDPEGGIILNNKVGDSIRTTAPVTRNIGMIGTCVMGKITIPADAPLDTWSSVWHLTTGDNYSIIGNRIPGLWFKRTADGVYFHVKNDTENSMNFGISETEYIYFPGFETEFWVTQNVTTTYIYWYINGVMAQYIATDSNSVRKDSFVYLSDPWYDSFFKMRDFIVFDRTLLPEEIYEITIMIDKARGKMDDKSVEYFSISPRISFTVGNGSILPVETQLKFKPSFKPKKMVLIPNLTYRPAAASWFYYKFILRLGDVTIKDKIGGGWINAGYANSSVTHLMSCSAVLVEFVDSLNLIPGLEYRIDTYLYTDGDKCNFNSNGDGSINYDLRLEA